MNNEQEIGLTVLGEASELTQGGGPGFIADELGVPTYFFKQG